VISIPRTIITIFLFKKKIREKTLKKINFFILVENVCQALAHYYFNPVYTAESLRWYYV
jgi:hypothetical protein